MGMLLYVPKRAQGSRMSYDLLQSKLPEVTKRSIVCISIIVNIFHLKEEFLYLQAYTSENLQCIGQQFENTQLLCLAFLTGLHIVGCNTPVSVECWRDQIHRYFQSPGHLFTLYFPISAFIHARGLWICSWTA